MLSVTSDTAGVLSTTTLQTILAAPTDPAASTASTTPTATTSSSVDNGEAALQAAPTSTTSVISQDLGQVASSPTSSAPPSKTHFVLNIRKRKAFY